MVRWFIYQIVDVPCHLIYVGSSTLPASRFSTHKSTCNSESSKSTGLSKHFMNGGCPNDEGREKSTLVVTLVDHLDTTQTELEKVGHVSGPKCVCQICDKLKQLEDRFIMKTGSFYDPYTQPHSQRCSNQRPMHQEDPHLKPSGNHPTRPHGPRRGDARLQ